MGYQNDSGLRGEDEYIVRLKMFDELVDFGKN